MSLIGRKPTRRDDSTSTDAAALARHSPRPGAHLVHAVSLSRLCIALKDL